MKSSSGPTRRPTTGRRRCESDRCASHRRFRPPDYVGYGSRNELCVCCRERSRSCVAPDECPKRAAPEGDSRTGRMAQAPHRCRGGSPEPQPLIVVARGVRFHRGAQNAGTSAMKLRFAVWIRASPEPRRHLLNRCPSSSRQDVSIHVQRCGGVTVSQLLADQLDCFPLSKETGGHEMPEIVESYFV